MNFPEHQVASMPQVEPSVDNLFAIVYVFFFGFFVVMVMIDTWRKRRGE